MHQSSQISKTLTSQIQLKPCSLLKASFPDGWGFVSCRDFCRKFPADSFAFCRIFVPRRKHCSTFCMLCPTAIRHVLELCASRRRFRFLFETFRLLVRFLFSSETFIYYIKCLALGVRSRKLLYPAEAFILRWNSCTLQRLLLPIEGICFLLKILCLQQEIMIA